VVVRGTVYATAGQIGGNTIDSTSIHSGTTGYGTGSGFYLGSNGTMSLGTKFTWDGANLNINGGGTFAGSLSAATGTFAGSLSAATGTFSGTLAANAINAVNTINIAENAVTVPVGAPGNGSVPALSITLSQAGTIYVTVTANAAGEFGGQTSFFLTAKCGSSLGPVVGISLFDGYAGCATAIGTFEVAAGTHTVTGVTSFTGPARTIGTTGLFAIGVKR
jgi:hypothetical protein